MADKFTLLESSQQPEWLQTLIFQKYLADKQKENELSTVEVSDIRDGSLSANEIGTTEQGSSSLIDNENTTTVDNEVTFSPVDANEFDKELFIEEVRKHRCLWDTNSSSFKDRQVKRNAWEQINKVFGKEESYLVNELKKLKDNLKKCLTRRDRMSKSGAAASSLPKCKYFDQMLFLVEKSSNLPTVSNISLPGINENIPPIEDTIVKPVSSKKSRLDQSFDGAILKQLETTNNYISGILKHESEEDVEVSLFCRSLIPRISSLPLRKKRLSMKKIQDLLFDIEFSE